MKRQKQKKIDARTKRLMRMAFQAARKTRQFIDRDGAIDSMPSYEDFDAWFARVFAKVK